MHHDADNPVVRLCAAGMAVAGDRTAARALFEQAWAIRRDDYDASIAAHYLAQVEESPHETLRWNLLAARHAESVAGDRALGFLASLYLNLGESHRQVGEWHQAQEAVARARAALAHLQPGGYRDFVAAGIGRLAERLHDTEG